MLSVKNPIMTGFFPDPSICRVGNKFYTVHSTFAYFPGVPVFESEDLVHWNLISNVLDRDSQVPLSGCQHSQGIFAPTIRYHKGTWYMITTNVSDQGNFIVTAKDPRGPWSEPSIWVSLPAALIPVSFLTMTVPAIISANGRVLPGTATMATAKFGFKLWIWTRCS